MSNEPLLIAVDLDGTLLTDQKMITPRTKKALQEAIKQGHKVVISTGRPYRSSKAYYDELRLQTPIVNFNGALVHHPQDRDWGLFHAPLELGIAQNVIRVSEKFGVQNIMIEVLDDVYLKERDEALMEIYFDPPDDVRQLPKVLHQDPTSVLIHAYDHTVEELLHYLEENHAEVIEHRAWRPPWNVIEIVRSGLNKAVGLERICRHYGIPSKNVLAFGDEDNDIEMIQFAGTGIAMANAITDLKERANEITLSNEKDGIAHFLEKNVL